MEQFNKNIPSYIVEKKIMRPNGLINYTVFSDGRKERFIYDDADNIKYIKISMTGWAIIFEADQKGRLSKVTHSQLDPYVYLDKNLSFKSLQQKYCYLLLMEDAEVRRAGLNITANHYENKDIAKSWFDTIAPYANPRRHGSDAAFKRLNEMYADMIKH